MRSKQGERGAAAVELAVVLPVLMLLLWGIVEFGRGYSATLQLTSAVRKGARAAALVSGDPAAVTTNAAGLSGVTVTPTPCPAPVSTGSEAKVTATYPFTYDILFFGKRTVTLKATAVMRCGG